MSNKIEVCFNGCSFTEGEGFAHNTRDQYIYDRLVQRHYNFDRTNIAIAGSSNLTIFLRSAQALRSLKYNIVVTQWTALNRIWFSPGPDGRFFSNDNSHGDEFVYRDLRLTPGEKKQFRRMLVLLNHDYQNLLDLIDYYLILEELAESHKVKLVHINGLVPWTRDLIESIAFDNLHDSLSPYTKTLLDFDTRDDWEIIKYVNILRDRFKLINQQKWVNLFDSFLDNTCDTGPEGHHPGIQSHIWMADKIINYINRENLI